MGELLMTQLKSCTWETKVKSALRNTNMRLTGDDNDCTRKGSGHLAFNCRASCSCSLALTEAKPNREHNKLKKREAIRNWKVKGHVYWLPLSCMLRRSMTLLGYLIASWSHPLDGGYLQFCCFCIVAFTVQAFTGHLLKVCPSKKTNSCNLVLCTCYFTHIHISQCTALS